MPAADPAILTQTRSPLPSIVSRHEFLNCIGGLKREFREISYWLATPVSLVTKMLKYNRVVAFYDETGAN